MTHLYLACKPASPTDGGGGLCRLYANVKGIDDDDDSITLPLTSRSFLRRGQNTREAGVR